MTSKRKKPSESGKGSDAGTVKSKRRASNTRDKTDLSVDLTEILNRKWTTFRVSPLYGFNSTKLKRYGIKATEELNAQRRFNSTKTFKCTFSIDETLRQNNECSGALQVQVVDNHLKCVYNGYFLDWAQKSQDSPPDHLSLPILLVEAKGFDCNNIHSIICKIFDCDIQPVTFSFHALVTFLVKLLENPRKGVDIAQELLTLEYKIPECKPTDRLKVTLFLQDTTIILAIIMDHLRENFKEISNMEIILEFYSRVLNHIYTVYQLDLMLANLYKIVFPDAFVTIDGQVKMSSNEVATTMLNVLQCVILLDETVTSSR